MLRGPVAHTTCRERVERYAGTTGTCRNTSGRGLKFLANRDQASDGASAGGLPVGTVVSSSRPRLRVSTPENARTTAASDTGAATINPIAVKPGAAARTHAASGGATIPPSLLLPAASPLPVPRRRVGYTSAVYGDNIEMIPPLPSRSSTTSGMSQTESRPRPPGSRTAKAPSDAQVTSANRIMLRLLLHS